MRVPSGLHKYVGFYPGHLKYDYGYSIGKLKPDIVLQLWKHKEEAKPYLKRDYKKIRIENYTFYFRKNSPNILWNIINKMQKSKTPNL